MFPRLSDLLNYLFGSHLNLPFRTYGFMLAMGFLAGGMILRSELKRKERDGLLHPSETGFRPYRHTWSILVVALVSAIAGSKIFDLFDHFGGFLRNPMAELFSFNGFAFNGGLILTVVALVAYMRVIRLDWKHVIDATAPAIAAGYAIGRLGCHLSGDGCWGIPSTMPPPGWLNWLPGWLWACHYPHNVANAGTLIPGCSGAYCRMLEQPVFPTSLYEAALSLMIAGLLWRLRKRIKAPVVLFGLFLVLYATERLLMEQIRINTRHDLFGMHLSQAGIISVVLILTGLAVILNYLRRHRRDCHPV